MFLCLMYQLTKVCVYCLSICALPCCCIILFIAFVTAQSSSLTPSAKMGTDVPTGVTKLSSVIVNPYTRDKKPPLCLPILSRVKLESFQSLYFTQNKVNVLKCHHLCLPLPLPPSPIPILLKKHSIRGPNLTLQPRTVICHFPNVVFCVSLALNIFFSLPTTPLSISSQSTPTHPSRLSLLITSSVRFPRHSPAKLVRLYVLVALCSGLYYNT